MSAARDMTTSTSEAVGVWRALFASRRRVRDTTCNVRARYMVNECSYLYSIYLRLRLTFCAPCLNMFDILLVTLSILVETEAFVDGR